MLFYHDTIPNNTMSHTILNKDILLHISTFLDRQSIFTFALCNKRINSVLRLVINKKYSYIINNDNLNNISTKYLAYTISSQLRMTIPIPDLLDIIDKQIKLNTLEHLYVSDAFACDMTTNYISLLEDSDYDIALTLKKYNIVINGIGVHSSKISDMKKLLGNFDKLSRVYITGNYYQCNTNYSSIKFLNTNTSSLYLLKNFRNITALSVHSNGASANCPSSEIFNIRDYIFTDLIELYIDYSCNIKLESLLDVCPNLETIIIFDMSPTCNTLYSIEQLISTRCTTQMLLLSDIVEDISENSLSMTYEEYTDHGIYIISEVMRGIISKITKKYININNVNIFCYSYELVNGVVDHITKLHKDYPSICKLNGDTVYDILVCAYKISCLYHVVYLIDENSRPTFIEMLTNM